MRIAVAAPILLAALLSGCGENARLPTSAGTGPDPALPPPTQSSTVNIAPARGWSSDAMPTPAAGLSVTAFARNLDHPRWLHVLPNGDVLVAETNAQPKRPDSLRAFAMDAVMTLAGAEVASPDRITLLRDRDGDGVAETASVLIDGLTSPFGMALVGGEFYVADTDQLLAFPYEPGAARITAPGRPVASLPAGDINHHWTKGLAAGWDGTIYVSVGSNSDHGENGLDAERGRAAIWRIDPADGSAEVFASGLRNPVGLDFEPRTGALWAVVNERDELGGDLVPDYLTEVRAGGFYGWPYSY
jgi:glucose/arabinose dehydrogenase